MEAITLIISEELTALMGEIKARQVAEGKTATGRTLSMYHVVSKEDGATLYGAKWVDHLQRGRGAGKVPYNFAQILSDWARAKGIRFETAAQARRWAYFAAKKIREQGTELHRSGRRLDILDTPITETVKRIKERLGAAFKLQITKNLT